MERSKLLPRSKATNAYDLLTDVRKAITEEPKRLDMGFWYYRGRRLKRLLAHRHGSRFPAKATEAPACGTVACAAGWIVALADRLPRDPYDTGQKALDILAPPPKSTNWKDGWDDYKEIRGTFERLFLEHPLGALPGSKAYALIVAGDIRLLQKRFKAQLLSTPVKIRRSKPKAKAVGRRKVSVRA